MKKILLIAQYEFLAVIGQASYILSFIGVPLLLILIGAATIFLARKAEEHKENTTIGIIDHANFVDFGLVKAVLEAEVAQSGHELGRLRNLTFTPYENLDIAMPDLRNDKLETLYVIESDYLQTGNITAYTLNKGLFGSDTDVSLLPLHQLLRASLIQTLAPRERLDGNITEPTLNRALTWTEIRELTVTSDGQLRSAGDELEESARVFVPVVISFLLISSLFVSSGYLLRAIVEEKTTRVIEVLLSSVSPNQLLWGKILGLGGAALLQMSTYTALGGLSILFLGSLINVSLGSLTMSLIYCLAGFLFYSGLLIGTGIIAGNLRESAQVSGFWALVAISPFLFIGLLFNKPNGLAAQILSYIPMTSSVTMVFRLSLADIPIRDQIISLTMLVMASYLSVRIAGKILRTGSLVYGSQTGLLKLKKWLRHD